MENQIPQSHVELPASSPNRHVMRRIAGAQDKKFRQTIIELMFYSMFFHSDKPINIEFASVRWLYRDLFDTTAPKANSRIFHMICGFEAVWKTAGGDPCSYSNE